jgi:RND family efflux transporter MFP subunit
MLAALSACSGPQEELPPPPVRPVKLFTVEGSDGAALRRFPGAISASQRAELSFRVNGVLQEILVKEGDQVKKGQVLARLDPTDYRIRVSDRQATFDSTEKNFNRAKELIQDGNISQTDYDRVEANFRTSEAALKLAKQDLAYTRLQAPFAGSIGRRDVENFEEIQAKQAIFQLQNVDQLDVAIGQALPANPRRRRWSKPMPVSREKKRTNSRSKSRKCQPRLIPRHKLFE